MTTLFDVGDALRGYRVAINARRLSKPVTINQSHDHKAYDISARDNVYCVIEMPLSARPKSTVLDKVQSSLKLAHIEGNMRSQSVM